MYSYYTISINQERVRNNLRNRYRRDSQFIRMLFIQILICIVMLPLKMTHTLYCSGHLVY
jgi:hypothetical protein